jgi:hypothetical protein
MKVASDNVIKKLFKFLKDFEIAPYLVNTKTVFMIYYFTCVSAESRGKAAPDILTP